MTNEGKTKLRESWKARIADFRASGQTGAAWCAANQIKEHQLWYWVQKFSGKTSSKRSSSTFIPVEIHDTNHPVHHTDDSLMIQVGQASIEVKPGFDAGLLRDVVKILAALC